MLISRQYLNVGGFAFNSSAMYLPLLFSLPLLPPTSYVYTSFLFPLAAIPLFSSLVPHTSFLFPLVTMPLFSSLLPPYLFSLPSCYQTSFLLFTKTRRGPLDQSTNTPAYLFPFSRNSCPLTTKNATNHSPSTLEQLQKLPRRRKLQDPITTIHDQHYILRVGAAGS